MTTCAAADACKATSEDAAVDEAVELALHQPRHLVPAASDGTGEGRAVIANSPMKRRVLDVTGPVARGQRGAGLGAAFVPVVAARQDVGPLLRQLLNSDKANAGVGVMF